MRRRKKALLLVILIVIPLVAITNMTSVVEASPLKMSVDPPVVYYPGIGSLISVDIVIDYIVEPYTYQFEMTFNPEVLHGVSVEVGPFLGSAGGIVFPAPGKGFDNETGKLWLTGAALAPPPPGPFPPTGGSDELGALATVTFVVVGLGHSDLTFGLNSGLTNSTGGFYFNSTEPEPCEGWAWGYKWIVEPPWPPRKEPNPEFLGHGYVTLAGDVDHNGKVDWKDLFALAAAYGSEPGDANWNPNCDFDRSGKVDWKDLFALAANYGKPK